MNTNTIIQPSTSDNAIAPDSSPLPSPRKLKTAIPPSPIAQTTVSNGRETIVRILEANDPRLLVVCGPCSIHDINAAIEYAKRLSHLARRVEDRIVVAMRTYFEKPRSIVGWKGLVYDPELNGSSEPTLGLGIARRLLAKVNEMAFLEPILPGMKVNFAVEIERRVGTFVFVSCTASSGDLKIAAGKLTLKL